MKELVGEEITLCKQLNELPEIVENKTNHWNLDRDWETT